MGPYGTIRDHTGPYHCKLLQLKSKLQGKAVAQSEKLEWWIISMVDCVTILLYTSVKRLHNPPSNIPPFKLFRLCNRFYIEGFNTILENPCGIEWSIQDNMWPLAILVTFLNILATILPIPVSFLIILKAEICWSC